MNHFVWITLTLWILTAAVFAAPAGAATYSPIVFIPGKGGSQLEARITRENPGFSKFPNCPETVPWFRIWLDVWHFLWPGQLNCWGENVKLYYNRTTRISSNAPGVIFRIPGFGETYSVEYIDDSWAAYLLGNLAAYLIHVTKELTKWGYTRGKDIRAAPYDFRYAPHSQSEYFDRLRHLVEETYTMNGKTRITLLAHSMGAIFAQYFLQTVSQRWKDKYVHAFVAVNSPWKGTVMISNLYTSGYNWGITPLDREILRTQQRSWETGVLLLPQQDAWGPDDVLVRTPNRNYTARDYDDYFRDVGHPIGKEQFDNIQHSSYDMDHPGVDTYCVYSYGIDTPEVLVYDEGEFPYGHATMLMGAGDGTVNLRSLEYCKQWIYEHDGRYEAVVKSFEGIQHIDLLFHKDFLLYLKQIVSIR